MRPFLPAARPAGPALRPAPYADPAHPAPTGYPRLLRTHRFRWWRAPLGVGVAVAVVVVVGGAVMVPLLLAGAAGVPGFDGLLEEDSLAEPPSLLVGNLLIALGGLAVVAAVVLAHQERPTWLWSVTGRVRWRLLAACAVLAVLTVASAAAVGTAVGAVLDLPAPSADEPRSVAVLWSVVAVVAVTTPLQATSEEVVFRGYLSQAVAAYGRSPVAGPVVAALVTGALFAGAHAPTDAWLTLDLFGFALVCSWAAWRTGGLEAAVALHVVNNLVVFAVTAATGTLEAALTATSLPAPVALVDLAFLLAYAAGVEVLARRLRPARHSAGSGIGASGTDRLNSADDAADGALGHPWGMG